MRVLIFALLALAVNATNYGWSGSYGGSSYGGSPSYSYSYSPSYGGYGSSLYGASYGSGLGSGYGSGYGSGFGSSYGSGSWGGSGGGQTYVTSYKPASYQTARYTYQQPQSIKTAYQTEYTSEEVPGSIVSTLGDTGASRELGYQEWKAPAAVSTHSYQQPHSTGAVYESKYSSGAAPGNIAFTLGGTGYQTGGTSGVSGYREWKAPVAVSRPAVVYRQRTATIHRGGSQGAVAPAKIGFTQDFGGVSAHRTIAPAAVITEKHSYQQPHSTGAVYDSGYSTGGAPGNIAFTLGGAGYQTGGASGVSGYQQWKAPAAVSRPAAVYRQRTTAIQRGVSQGAVAPAKIRFTQDFSGVAGLHRTGGGSAGMSTHRTIAPAPVRQSYRRPYSSGAAYQSRHSSGVAPGSISFTLGGAGYQTGTSGVSGHQEWKAPVAVSRPAGVVSHRTTSIRGTGVQGATGGWAPAKISFTQDFSRVSGQTGGLHRSGVTSGVSAFKKAVAPAVVVTEKHSSFGAGGAGSIHKLGGHDATGGVSEIHYQEIGGIGSGHVSGADFAGAGYQVSAPKRSHAIGSVGAVSGQPHITFTQDFSKVGGHSAAIKPEIRSYQRVTTPVRTAVAPKVSYGNTGVIRQSGFLGSTGARPQIRYTQGVSHQTSGQRVAGAHGFSSAGPAKITFTQDFSRVSGHQSTAGVKPAIHTFDKLGVSGFTGAFGGAGGYHQGHQTNVISAPKPVARVQFKAPKRPVAAPEPAITTVYEHSPVHGGAVVDKSVYVSPTKPATAVGAPVVEYKQEMVAYDGGVDKQSNIYYVPGGEVRSATYKHSSDAGIGDGQGGVVTSSFLDGGVPNKFVVIPTETYATDKQSVLVHSSGGSGLTSQNFGGYSAVSTPFKSHYSSSYPGYSHVSGESPRYDFSTDRNLLYTYSSPNIVSPFSYTYSSGKGQYDKKAA